MALTSCYDRGYCSSVCSVATELQAYITSSIEDQIRYAECILSENDTTSAERLKAYKYLYDRSAHDITVCYKTLDDMKEYLKKARYPFDREGFGRAHKREVERTKEASKRLNKIHSDYREKLKARK